MINNIHHTDCIEGLKYIHGDSVDLIITDAPYGMNFQSNSRKVKHAKIINDDNLDWMPEVFKNCKRVLKNDCHAYFFCSFHFIDTFLTQLKSAGFIVKNIIVWQKNGFGMGDLDGDYAPQYEFIIFCSNGVKKLNGRRDSNIIKYARTNNDNHPTEKPIDLIRFLLLKSSNENDIVLDCFMGSGTTAVACIKEKRKFIGFEIDEKHYLTSIKRIKNINIAQELF